MHVHVDHPQIQMRIDLQLIQLKTFSRPATQTAHLRPSGNDRWVAHTRWYACSAQLAAPSPDALIAAPLARPERRAQNTTWWSNLCERPAKRLPLQRLRPTNTLPSQKRELRPSRNQKLQALPKTWGVAGAAALTPSAAEEAADEVMVPKVILPDFKLTCGHAR